MTTHAETDGTETQSPNNSFSNVRIFGFSFMDAWLNLLCIAQIVFYIASLSHNQRQTNCFHILFPDTASCKQRVPVRSLCLAQSRASAERQVDKAHARRAPASVWSYVCVSTANVHPFFPEDLATNPPPPLHVTVMNGRLPSGKLASSSARRAGGNVRKRAFI